MEIHVGYLSWYEQLLPEFISSFIGMCWKCNGSTNTESNSCMEHLLNSTLSILLFSFNSLSGKTTSKADMNAGNRILTPSKSKWNILGELIKIAAMHSPHSRFEEIFNPYEMAK